MNIIYSCRIIKCLATLLYIGCIYFGASWYRFFGAGEQMALMAEQGSSQPTIITLGIFSVLALYSAYAFSAAGLIVRLPFISLVMPLIYLIRGLAGFTLMDNPMGCTPGFWLWSSGIYLTIGIFHAVGLQQLIRLKVNKASTSFAK